MPSTWTSFYKVHSLVRADVSSSVAQLSRCNLAPDRHATEAELLEREREECDEPGLVKMIANGLQLQIEQ